MTKTKIKTKIKIKTRVDGRDGKENPDDPWEPTPRFMDEWPQKIENGKRYALIGGRWIRHPGKKRRVLLPNGLYVWGDRVFVGNEAVAWALGYWTIAARRSIEELVRKLKCNGHELHWMLREPARHDDGKLKGGVPRLVLPANWLMHFYRRVIVNLRAGVRPGALSSDDTHLYMRFLQRGAREEDWFHRTWEDHLAKGAGIEPDDRDDDLYDGEDFRLRLAWLKRTPTLIDGGVPREPRDPWAKP